MKTNLEYFLEIIFTYGSLIGLGYFLGWEISVLMLFFIMGHIMDKH